MTNAATVASAIVETVAMRIPAMIAGRASGSSTRQRIWRPLMPIPRAASSTSGGRRAQPGEDVPEQDQEGVGDERHLDGRHRQAGQRDEELEEREARDRVEERGDEVERPLEDSGPAGDSAAAKAMTKPTVTAISVSLTCWRSAGWSTSPQLSRTHSGQKRRFSWTQSLASPKSGITGSVWARGRSRGESRGERIQAERAPRPACVVEDDDERRALGEHRRERVAEGGRATGGPGVTEPFSGSSSTSSRRVSESRFSPRSPPTKVATKSSAGAARIASGVSYWASRPPGRRIAIRSPIRIASSMSWVTKITVFSTARVDPQELVLQPRPRDRIERTEGLVHEHHGRIGREGAREPDPLALAARELGRVARAVVAGGQVDEVEQLVHALVDPTLVPAEEPWHGGDVLGHGHVGKEPRLLDDIADPATELGGVERADAPVADADVAFGDVDQAVDHLHRGRLAAARGPDEHADLAGRDDEREIVDGRGGCGPGSASSRGRRRSPRRHRSMNGRPSAKAYAAGQACDGQARGEARR